MADMTYESATAQIRKATETSLDVYERSAKAYADVHERAGQASNVLWVQHLARVQADLLRDTAGTYAQTARELTR